MRPLVTALPFSHLGPFRSRLPFLPGLTLPCPLSPHSPPLLPRMPSSPLSPPAFPFFAVSGDDNPLMLRPLQTDGFPSGNAKQQSKVALAPVGGPGKYAKMLARANVSKDTAYNLDSKGRKGEQGGSANKPGSRHALLALNMRTSALNLSEEELLSFHRPRAIMMVWPGKPTKLHRSISVKGKDKNPMITLTLRTLSGFVGVRKNIPAKDFTVKQVWAEWSKKMQRLDGEGMPQLRQDAPTGMVLPSKDGGTLFQAGIKASSTVWAIFKQVCPPPPPLAPMRFPACLSPMRWSGTETGDSCLLASAGRLTCRWSR